MAKKICPPSIRETAFICAHCGAFTTQYWFQTRAVQLSDEHPLPSIQDEQWLEKLQADATMEPAVLKELADRVSKITSGLVLLAEEGETEWSFGAYNLHISRCYNCRKIAVWVHNTMVFPHERQGPQPNQDLPSEVAKDFEEARSIVALSPRGAAALLRLSIQKLCVLLGRKGRNIDDDIASLVGDGLNPLVQKALDIVRVIGNEAVHPGTIDLNDNREIADQLFGLVNSIADQMITHPKNVTQLYEKLPAAKREAIERRDGKGQQ